MMTAKIHSSCPFRYKNISIILYGKSKISFIHIENKEKMVIENVLVIML